MTENFKLYLASASPRRKELLNQIGVPFQLLTVDVTELIESHASPLQNAERLALKKAQAGLISPARKEHKPVLGADTVVVIDNHILEKPKDKSDFIRMMRLLSGKTHEVITAIALVDEKLTVTASSTSQVEFRELTDAEIETYWHSGEPQDKAGGYGIQGIAAVFIKEIKGSHSGIMGLPLFDTAELLKKFAITII